MKKLNLFIIFFVISVFHINLAISQNSLKIKENDFFIGLKEAPVTIIEYASLSCSHCAKFHNDTLADLKSEYVDTGKVKIVFRDFPFNYPALLGSMVLRCVPKNVRYDYMNALFELQTTWVNRENAKTIQELYKIMQSGGMTKEQYETCIFDVELEKQILEGVMEAQEEFNIKSTPSFIINGSLVEGNKSIKEFRQIIDKILSEN